VSVPHAKSPPVEIVGLHPIPGHDDVHLLEVMVYRPAASFDVSQFTQEDPGQPRPNWQVAYDEKYLSADGASVLSQFEAPPLAGDTARLAFFMFFLDLDRPLLTPFGPVPLPTPTPAPHRLLSIARFEPPN